MLWNVSGCVGVGLPKVFVPISRGSLFLFGNANTGPTASPVEASSSPKLCLCYHNTVVVVVVNSEGIRFLSPGEGLIEVQHHTELHRRSLTAQSTLELQQVLFQCP